MHIKTPDNVRVEQWNDISMDQGKRSNQPASISLSWRCHGDIATSIFCCSVLASQQQSINRRLPPYRFILTFPCLFEGMKQFEFQLADEPAMGFYTITVKRNGEKYSEQFEVKEYGKLTALTPLIWLILQIYRLSLSVIQQKNTWHRNTDITLPW